jgi:hypothetical protein
MNPQTPPTVTMTPERLPEPPLLVPVTRIISRPSMVVVDGKLTAVRLPLTPEA